MPSAPFVRAPSTSSAVGLVIANLVPIAGVIWLGWDLFGIMALYWAENGVIGVFAVLRMMTAGEPIRWWTAALRVFPAGFFVFHYGLFWVVHGVFVLTLFSGGAADPFDDGLGALSTLPAEGLILLVVSHGLSFALNYLIGGEWRATDTITEMGKPYGRVVVLHIVILAGGFILLPTDGARWALVLLVVVKTVLDLGIHLKDHQARLAKASGAEADPDGEPEASRPLAAPEAPAASR
ncbi:MAG: DUF6498-containing protein [Bacteroidota bacterium]